MEDLISYLSEKLNIPETCLQEENETQFTAIVHKDWLVNSDCVYELNESEIKEVKLSKSLPEEYCRVQVTARDSDQLRQEFVIQNYEKNRNEDLFDLQFFVNNENFLKQRKIAFERFPNSYSISDDLTALTPKIRQYTPPLNYGYKSNHVNLLESVNEICKENHIFEVTPVITHSVNDALMYSPCMLDNRKKSFILYQLLQVFDYFHENYPLCKLNPLNWAQISLDLKTWVRAQLADKLGKNPGDLKPDVETLSNCCHGDINNYESLNEVMDKWICGKMTNFDYLMHLNKLAGRRMKDPHHHPILPWISDLSQREGVWRDFTKSKYRLNKGDDQLRLQYEMSLNAESSVKFGETAQVPHHVPDMLSDITYYVYMARVVPREILQKHVRSYWEPNEYPATVQRIQEWSPDECVPEFFTDPGVFRSLHPDMGHLGVPEWCKSPEEFVESHMKLLESSRVSEQLHEWIDLTFGFKLSGRHSVESLNVYRQLTDRHTNSLDRGIVQLFSKPHPQRRRARDTKCGTEQEDEVESEINGIETENFSPPEGVDDSVVIEDKNKINLPKDFQPLEALEQLEKLLNFKESDLYNSQFSECLKETLQSEVKNLVTYKIEDKVNDENIILFLCLAIELFLSPKMQSLDINAPLFIRFQDCISCYKANKSTLPTEIKHFVKFILSNFAVSIDQVIRCLRDSNKDHEFSGFPTGIFRNILKQGFPTISPAILLSRSSNILQFPTYFKLLYKFLSFIAVSTHHYSRPLDVSLVPELHNKMLPLFNEIHGCSEGFDIFLSHLIALLEINFRDATPVLVEVFDRVSMQLSHQQLNDQLLPIIISIYSSINSQLKVGSPVLPLVGMLYDKAFLLQLSVRFGLETFLAVFPKIMTDCLILVDSDIIANSIQWLILRCGPTLSSKFIIRDLLRAVNICFHEQTVSGMKSRHKRVIDCLVFCASVYGSCFFTLQFIPHIAFTVCTAISGTRFTNRSFAAMEASVVVLDHLVAHLSDKTLMEQLSRLSKEVVMPLIGLLSSLRIKFPGGVDQRKGLCLKAINLIVNVAIRIGRDMSKKYLTGLLQSFFSNFNQVKNDSIAVNNEDKFEDEYDFSELVDPFTDSIATAVQLGGSTQSWLNDSPSSSLNNTSEFLSSNPVAVEPSKTELEQQRQNSLIRSEVEETFTSEMLFHAYVPLARLMGEIHMKKIYPDDEAIVKMTSTFERGERKRIPSESIGDPPNITMVGNRIIVSDKTMENNQASNHTNKKDFNENVNGHLKDNWLAYWEHEVGLPDVDNHIHFNQIGLQTFNGHSSAVRCLHAHNSEEWFLSGSKDKTIKIWSLQNTTSEPIQPSYSYTNHKKTPFYVDICEPLNSVVSCDGMVHLWDPYNGKLIHGFENSDAKTSVVAASVMPRPCQQVLVATADATLRMVDLRHKAFAQEYRTCPGNSAGAIKSICTSGNWVAVGFTYGVISLVDTRMGSMLRMWQAHDSDVITSNCASQSTFLTSSVDQTIALWDTGTVNPRMVYRSISEQVHTIETFHDEIISASQANRINVHPLISNIKEGTNRGTLDKAITVTKLKSDSLRGTLNTLKVLPMKRQILVASESGDLRLLS